MELVTNTDDREPSKTELKQLLKQYLFGLVFEHGQKFQHEFEILCVCCSNDCKSNVKLCYVMLSYLILSYPDMMPDL